MRTWEYSLGKRRFMGGVAVGVLGFAVCVLSGCAGITPASHQRDVEPEGYLSASGKTSKSARRKEMEEKKRRQNETADVDRLDMERRDVVEGGASRLSSSVRKDLEAWRAEVTLQENRLQEYELKRANDDEMRKEVLRRLDEANSMVGKFEQVSNEIDGISPSSRMYASAGGSSYAGAGDYGGRREVGGYAVVRAPAARSPMSVDPLDFSATGSSRRASGGGRSAPTEYHGIPGSVAVPPTPMAMDFLPDQAGMGSSGGSYVPMKSSSEGEWVTIEEE